jgi:hypothetical protein
VDSRCTGGIQRLEEVFDYPTHSGSPGDEPMATNIVASIECQEKCSDLRSVVGNLSQYPIQFGTFSIDRKYYKEYDKLGCEVMEMWRRPASTGGGGLQSFPNC